MIGRWLVGLALLAHGVAYGQTQPVINFFGEYFSGFPAVSPGAVAVILGSNFVDTPGTNPGTTKEVFVNGVAAQIQVVDKGEGDRVFFLIPFQTLTGRASLTVSHAGVSSAVLTIQVVPFCSGTVGQHHRKRFDRDCVPCQRSSSKRHLPRQPGREDQVYGLGAGRRGAAANAGVDRTRNLCQNHPFIDGNKWPVPTPP